MPSTRTTTHRTRPPRVSLLEPGPLWPPLLAGLLAATAATSSCAATHERAGGAPDGPLPVFGPPPAPAAAPARPGAPTGSPARDCASACAERGLECVAEGLCAARAPVDTGIAATVGRYAVAPLADPARPGAVAIASHEYLWSEASDARSFLQVGVLDTRDGGLEAYTRQPLQPSNWVLFDVAVGGPPEARRVFAAWQDGGVHLATFAPDGSVEVRQLSSHDTENVLDVVGTPTGGAVSDGEPLENPRIVPSLYRLTGRGTVLDQVAPRDLIGAGEMLDRIPGAPLVAMPDGGLDMLFVRRAVDPRLGDFALQVIRHRDSLAEAEVLAVQPPAGETLPPLYEPLRAWAAPASGRVLLGLPATDGPFRLASLPGHVGGGAALRLGPTQPERPEDLAAVSGSGTDRLVAVYLSTEYDAGELLGCAPPTASRTEVALRAFDLDALAPSGDRVLVAARDATAPGELSLQSAPRVVALDDGDAFAVFWLDDGTLRYRRFELLAPPPAPGGGGS